MPRKQGMIARYVLNVEVMMTQPRFPLNGKPEPELRESIHGFPRSDCLILPWEQRLTRRELQNLSSRKNAV